MGNFNINAPKPRNLGGVLNPVKSVSPIAVNTPNPIPAAPMQQLAPAKPTAPMQPAAPIQSPINFNPLNAFARGNVRNSGSIREILQNQFNKAAAPAPVAPVTPVPTVNPSSNPSAMQNSPNNPMTFYGSNVKPNPNATPYSEAWWLANGGVNVPVGSQQYNDNMAAN
jgi:hypothetical protein